MFWNQCGATSCASPSFTEGSGDVGGVAEGSGWAQGSMAAVAFDIDQDGDLDLYLANRGSFDQLLTNSGSGRGFNASTLGTCTNNNCCESCISWAAITLDANGDGLPDIFVVRTGAGGTNALLLNDGAGGLISLSANTLGVPAAYQGRGVTSIVLVPGPPPLPPPTASPPPATEPPPPLQLPPPSPPPPPAAILRTSGYCPGGGGGGAARGTVAYATASSASPAECSAYAATAGYAYTSCTFPFTAAGCSNCPWYPWGCHVRNNQGASITLQLPSIACASRTLYRSITPPEI